MSKASEYCIVCKVKLEVISSHTTETVHELHSFDINAMHATATQEPKSVKVDAISYCVRCPRCHNSQAVDITLIDSPAEGG